MYNIIRCYLYSVYTIFPSSNVQQLESRDSNDNDVDTPTNNVHAFVTQYLHTALIYTILHLCCTRLLQLYAANFCAVLTKFSTLLSVFILVYSIVHFFNLQSQKPLSTKLKHELCVLQTLRSHFYDNSMRTGSAELSRNHMYCL